MVFDRFGLEIRILHEKLVWGHQFKPVFHHFLKFDFLEKSVFGYFFTFEPYFEAWEHQNRTQLEKISHGSYFQIFWPDGKLIGARRRSKLALLFVLVKVFFSAAA